MIKIFLGKSEIYIVIFSSFLMYLSSFMLLPYLPNYILNELKYNMDTYGVAMAIFLLSQKGFAIFGGLLSDQYGEKYIISLSFILKIIAFILLTFCINKYFLFLSMFLLGLSISFFSPPSKKILAKHSNESSFMKYLSFRSISVNLGVSLGPILGLFFLSSSFKLICYISSIACLLLFFIYLIITKNNASNHEKNNFTIRALLNLQLEIIKNKYFIICFIFSMIFFFYYYQIDVTLPILAKEQYGDVGNTLLFSINALVVIILQYFVSKKNTTYSFYKSMYLCFLFFLISFLLFSYSINIYMFIIAIAFFSFSELLFEPKVDLILSKNLLHKQLGSGLGIVAFGSGIGGAIGSLIGSKVFPLLNRGHSLNLWIIFSISLFFILFILTIYRYFNVSASFRKG